MSWHPKYDTHWNTEYLSKGFNNKYGLWSSSCLFCCPFLLIRCRVGLSFPSAVTHGWAPGLRMKLPFAFTASVISLWSSAWHWNRGFHLGLASRRQVSSSWAFTVLGKRSAAAQKHPLWPGLEDICMVACAHRLCIQKCARRPVDKQSTNISKETWQTYHWKSTFLWSIDQGLP